MVLGPMKKKVIRWDPSKEDALCEVRYLAASEKAP